MKWVLGVSIIAIAMGWVATATIPAATVSIDENSLKFLPPETQGVAFIDLAALRNAPLVKEMLQKDQPLTPAPGLNDFVTATGVDPVNDIDKVTIGKLGAAEGLVILQGRIDKFKVEQFLKDHGKESEAYLGQTIYRDGDGAFLLLDNAAVLGQLNAVKKAVDQMQLPAAAPLKAELMAAIQTIDAGNQIWGVGEFSFSDLATIGVQGPAPAMEMLKSLKSGTGQLRVDTGVHARGTATFTDSESAKNIADLGRGALAIGKLQIAKQQPEMLPLLDGIQVSNSGTMLTIKIDESGELLQKLKELRLGNALAR